MTRPPDRVPWVRYEPVGLLDWLGSASKDAELAHRRFCDYHWSSGRWPTLEAGRAWRLARVTERSWPGVLAHLLTLGWRVRGKTLTHSAVRQARTRAVRALKSASKAGTCGAQRRWAGGLARSAAPSLAQPPLPVAGPATPIGAAISDPIGAAHGDPIGAAMATPMLIKTVKNDKRLTEQPSLAFNAERLPLNVLPPEKLSSPEQTFLESVGEMVRLCEPHGVDAEILNWGGWWRKRFREDPDKARRIVADITNMVREGKIHTTPGRAAYDLWRRLP